MRAKLAVYEAERVPFSPEELALLESGVDETLLSEGPAFQPTRTLSMDQGADMDRLEREATQAIDANDFAAASERLLQILEVLPDNVAILSNLAFVEMQLERLDMAQTRLQKALDLDPNYVNAHMLLGMLQAEKQNPEEALNHLSKGAAIQPENPQIQNQLGVVLSELGQREAAETAFRKAVALQPSHAEAHINLALVYASQEPASPKLAMYHYQLALDAGHDKEPRLERLLSEIQP
jgi:Flp pilus assembly protein TadD